MRAPISAGSVPAVVLAGGTAKPEFIQKTGLTNRALIEVDGKTMLQKVVEALRGASVIGQISVVSDLPGSSEYISVSDHGGFVENIFAGVEASPPCEYVLISTADVPFLTSDAVQDLVVRGAGLGADIVYPVVEVAECYRRFPGVKRTAVKLNEGEYTGGNLVLARPEFLKRQKQHLIQAYAARKSPVKIAVKLGAGTILRFVLSKAVSPVFINIPLLEGKVSGVLGGTARALISPYPELATDIDRVEDLEAIAPLSRV